MHMKSFKLLCGNDWRRIYSESTPSSSSLLFTSILLVIFFLTPPANAQITCTADGGSVTGGPFEFCVGDGVPDNVSGVSVSGNTGTNSQWVVTDEDGNILGLPPSPQAVDFDGAPAGVCLIWHLAYDDGLTGLAMGNNTSDLMGCFDFSNSVSVNRITTEGGSVTGGPFEFCVGDGVPDNVSGVSVSGNTGTNSQWVVTDEDGNILGLPPSPQAVDFDGAPAGVCLIWHLAYDDGLTGLAMGNNTSDLMGCFDFSNSVSVNRITTEGGSVTGGPFEFCVGDGVPDNVSGVSVSGNTGTNSQWVVTDEDGNILGLPPSPQAVDFDGAPAGVCLIWHLAYDDGLTGLAMGNNTSDLMGCFDFSNSVSVNRITTEGGSVTGGPFEFCVGDGVPDNVSGVSVSGNTGTNSQWVVTDEDGNILGLPPSPQAVDFDGAPAGVCLIWHLAYDDGLTGLAMGNNTSDLMGCFDFSNSVSVNRITTEGGSVTGGPFEFCVGDGVPDNVSGVSVSGNTGTNSQWVVTDEDGNILGLPPSPQAVDFDGAPAGVCLIWHLAYDDGLTGLAMGNNTSDLMGCFDFSNSVSVNRITTEGGSVTGGPFEFCVGDGVPDNVSGVSVSGNTGTNSQWVVTDEDGNILGLPPSPQAVDFDGAPAGVCLIWHLAYDDGLTGLAMGNNTSDLMGCFDFSNSITVNRLSQNDPGCGGGQMNTYVLIGFEEVDIERNIIHHGGVGATEDNGEVEVSEDSQITADGTFVEAAEIYINSGSNVQNAFANPATPQLPDFMENNTAPDNDQEVVVGAGETVTLTESLYEDVKIGDNAIVTFSGGENVYIEDLITGENVTLLFDQCTNLILSRKLSLGENNDFNPSEMDVFVFAERDADIRPGSEIYGVIYTKRKFNVRKGNANNPTLLHGMFIGDRVRTRDYAEYWYQAFTPCSGNILTPGSSQRQNDGEAVTRDNISFPTGRLSLYPNPAQGLVNLIFDEVASPTVQVSIYNAAHQLSVAPKKVATDEGQASIDIHHLPAGIYLVKMVVENGSIVTEKLIVTD